MAKRVKYDPTAFDFGANARRRKPKASKGKRGGGRKGNAWAAYVGQKR
jgi:hypothetical protein